MNKMEETYPSIRGDIVIPGGVSRFTGARAHITLEDISYLDTESKLIAETVLEDISHDEDETVIAFDLAVGDPSVIDENHVYAVGVRIEGGGPGKTNLFSDENHLVLTRGFGNEVRIKVG